jgi:hypothetical protein
LSPLGHTHGSSPSPDVQLRLPEPLRRLLAGVVGVFLLATLIGLVVLWPPATPRDHSAGLGTPVDLVNATVTAAPVVPCRSALPGVGLVCRDVTARLDSGPEKGDTTTLNITESPDQPTLSRSDRIVLGRAADPGQPVAYFFSDFQRRTPLLALGLLFAVTVVGLARWRGFAALLGLGVSLLVLVRFVLPAILAGESALAASIVGASLIAVLIIYLAHGVSAPITTAVLGTLAALALTAVLAVVFVEATKLTGLSSEAGTYLRGVLGSTVDLRGMLLAGIVIGALGVLNDVTVTQASAVWEIYRAIPPWEPATSTGRPWKSAVTTSPPPWTPWSWPTPAPHSPCSSSSRWPIGA